MRPMIFAVALFFMSVFFVSCGIGEDSEIKQAALNVSGIICFVGSFICASLDKKFNQ